MIMRPVPPGAPTRRLAAFAIANFCLVNLLLIGVFSARWNQTVLNPVSWFLTFNQGGDSWRPMKDAFNQAVSPVQNKSLYTKMFFSPQVKHKGFQYPPTSLLTVYFTRLLTGEHWYQAFLWITWLSVPLNAYFVVRIDALGQEARGARGVRALVLVFMTLTFFPAIQAYRNGQIQAWLNTLFTIALFSWMKGQRRLPGILLGAMSLIKPQYAVIALWGALRRQWSFVTSWLLVAAGGLLASVAVFGVAPHLEYRRVLRFISRRGESFYPNQSVNGLLNRLFDNGDSVAWMDSMPPYHPWVYAGTVASAALLLALALHVLARAPDKGGPTDFSLMTLTATMASPIAWEHHYGVLLPIFAFLLPRLLAQPVLGRLTLPCLAVAYVVASNSFMVTNRWARTRLGLFQSSLLGAAVLVWVLLYLVRVRGTANMPSRYATILPATAEAATVSGEAR